MRHSEPGRILRVALALTALFAACGNEEAAEQDGRTSEQLEDLALEEWPTVETLDERDSWPQANCELHGTRLVESRQQVNGGLLPSAYSKACLAEFPNSNLNWGGCSTPHNWFVILKYCEDCRDAERAWIQANY